MFFDGDDGALRFIPTPFHTKFAQERTALSQYIQQEAVGTRMRRWERPIHDFLSPHVRGLVERVSGQYVIPGEVEHRRDLDTLVDSVEIPGPSALSARLPSSQSAPEPSPLHQDKQPVFSSMLASYGEAFRPGSKHGVAHPPGAPNRARNGAKLRG